MHSTLLVDANYPNILTLLSYIALKAGKKSQQGRKKNKSRTHLHHKLYNAFFLKIWLLASEVEHYWTSSKQQHCVDMS